MPPEFFYFDIGNVLLTFDHDQMCRQLAGLMGVEPYRVEQTLLPHGDSRDLLWQFEAGSLSESAYYDRVCEALGNRPARQEFDLAKSDIFAPIGQTLQLAERMQSAGHRLGLLSNTNSIHWQFFLDGRYPTLNSAFEIAVSSFQANSMKPDPKIYELAVSQAGVENNRVFFTDDKPENVAGACEFGIDAVLFTSASQLEVELRDRGIDLG